MAEFTAGAQVLLAGQNIIFGGERHCGAVKHRDNTGTFTLKGGAKCNPAKYLVMVHAVTTATAAAPIQMVLAEDGEAMQATLMAVVPAAIGDIQSVDTSTEVTVYGDDAKVAVRAVSAVPLTSAVITFHRTA